MPLTPFSSGIIIDVSDDEVNNERFDVIWAVKWERFENYTKSYKRKPLRAVVGRNKEGDGYTVWCFVPKYHNHTGNTVEQSSAAISSEILRQHGLNLA
jgi:hypothetical protein